MRHLELCIGYKGAPIVKEICVINRMYKIVGRFVCLRGGKRELYIFFFEKNAYI